MDRQRAMDNLISCAFHESHYAIKRSLYSCVLFRTVQMFSSAHVSRGHFFVHVDSTLEEIVGAGAHNSDGPLQRSVAKGFLLSKPEFDC